jgi:photosystem II stability/assembly factor-like uncharacterized protein
MKVKSILKIRNICIIAISCLLTITSIPTNSITNQNREGWMEQTSGTNNDLQGISFINTSWGTTVGDIATILHTENNGLTWNSQSCGVSVDLVDVSFYNSNVGMAVGYEGTILNTSNGGETWTTYQTGWLITYYASHMVTDLIGYAAGVNTINQPLLTWTIDGWQTQNDIAFYIEHNSVMYEGQLKDIFFINSSTGFAAARIWDGHGAIAGTTDGGYTWDTKYWGNYGFWGIHFPSSEIGYAVGDFGEVVKTTDGGDTWNSLSSGVSYDLNDVSFANEEVGSVAGESNHILRTEDGGINWITEDSTQSNPLNSIYMLDVNNAYAAGDIGTIINRTGTSGPDTIDVIITILSQNWNFVSIPFNQSVNKTDIIVEYSDVNYSWSDAVSAGYINDFVFGWDRNTQGYIFSDKFKPGNGYWIYAYTDCILWMENITLEYDVFITDIKTKWNIIGLSYNQSVVKTNILVDEVPWDIAVSNGWISDFVFGWNRISQSYNFDDMLIPGYAYWMYAYQPCSLQRVT